MEISPQLQRDGIFSTLEFRLEEDIKPDIEPDQRPQIPLAQGPNPRGGWHQPPQPAQNRNSWKKPAPRPKRMFVYGHPEGTEVGRWFKNRKDASKAGVHGVVFPGIHWSRDGAYSVVLSGGYEDDFDDGEEFLYTGSGGRKPELQTPDNPTGQWRGTGSQQTCDQSMDSPPNAALRTSGKRKKPIRVLRGSQDIRSPYAPTSGYRYDGLYLCTNWGMAEGQSGYQVCKFAFKRLPDQPALPIIHPQRVRQETSEHEGSTVRPNFDKSSEEASGLHPLAALVEMSASDSFGALGL